MKKYEQLAEYGTTEEIKEAFAALFLLNAELEHENELLTKENNEFADKITEQAKHIIQLQIAVLQKSDANEKIWVKNT